jgi:hypothetical protein
LDWSHFRTAIAKDFVMRPKQGVERRRDAEDGIIAIWQDRSHGLRASGQFRID